MNPEFKTPHSPTEPSARPDEISDPLLTPAETAKRYRLSKSSLDKMRCRGDGPPYYAVTPRKILYRPSDVDAWLAQRRFRSTADYGGEQD